MEKRTAKKTIIKTFKTKASLSSTFTSYCFKDSEVYHGFPPLDKALNKHQGLIALTQGINEKMFVFAYHNSIFPWHEEDGLFYWYTPNPRAVFKVDGWKEPRTIARLRKQSSSIVCTINQSFPEVLRQVSNRENTWLSKSIQSIFLSLNRKGQALSFEVWQNNLLIGGLITIVFHPIMFGETMFSTQPGASKIAFYEVIKYAKENNYVLIDGQVESTHLKLLGASTISKKDYLNYLKKIP